MGAAGSCVMGERRLTGVTYVEWSPRENSAADFARGDGTVFEHGSVCEACGEGEKLEVKGARLCGAAELFVELPEVKESAAAVGVTVADGLGAYGFEFAELPEV